MTIIDTFVNEFDPMNDMIIAKQAFRPVTDDIRDNLEIILERISFAAKPFVRGGCGGAIAGALASLITGDTWNSVIYGALVGINIDSAQYCLHAAYHMINGNLK